MRALRVDAGLALGDGGAVGDSCAAAMLTEIMQSKSASSRFLVMSSEAETSLTVLLLFFKQ